MESYAKSYPENDRIRFAKSNAAGKFNVVVDTAKRLGFTLYLMLDEYDNFTNQMLRAEGNGHPTEASRTARASTASGSCRSRPRSTASP